MKQSTTALFILAAVTACSSEPADVPDGEPLTEEETALLTRSVEDTAEMLSEVNTTDFGVTALSYRRIKCADVETDRLTFLTVTFSCTIPFKISGTIEFEKSTPEQLTSITDLMVGKTAIDSATTLVVPADPKAPRTFDGALIVDGPRRQLSRIVSASWVETGKCIVLDAAIFSTRNAVEQSVMITGKRICRRFH